jgi:PhnB protein
MQVQPYLFFDFYQQAIGANVKMAMRWKDSPDQSMCTPANADKIMHAQFEVGDTTIMASDGCNSGAPKFDGFALTIAAQSEAEADTLFAALGAGGEVTMPLGKTFFSKRFGTLADKFGVHWMILVQ